MSMGVCVCANKWSGGRYEESSSIAFLPYLINSQSNPEDYEMVKTARQLALRIPCLPPPSVAGNTGGLSCLSSIYVGLVGSELRS